MTEGAQKQETGSVLHSPQAAQQVGQGLSFVGSFASSSLPGCSELLCQCLSNRYRLYMLVERGAQ